MPEVARKAMGRVPDMLEEANQFIWDSCAVATAVGASQYTMFQVPIGGAKTKLQTNMTQAGVLPTPKMMKVKALRIVLDPICTMIDAKSIISGSYLELWVGDKVMIEGPSWMFGQGCGVTGDSDLGAAAVGNVTGRNGKADPRSIFTLRYTIDIGVQTPFYGKIIFPAAVTMVATTNVWVVLEGTMWRGVA